MLQSLFTLHRLRPCLVFYCDLTTFPASLLNFFQRKISLNCIPFQTHEYLIKCESQNIYTFSIQGKSRQNHVCFHLVSRLFSVFFSKVKLSLLNHCTLDTLANFDFFQKKMAASDKLTMKRYFNFKTKAETSFLRFISDFLIFDFCE